MIRDSLVHRSLSRRLSCLAAATLMTSAADAWPQVWGLQVSTPGWDSIDALASDGSGGTIEVGALNGQFGFVNSTLYAARRDPSGALVWQKQWGTSAGDHWYDAVADGSGGCFVAGVHIGNLFGPSQGGYDGVVVRLDPSGNVVWSDQVGTSESDYALAVSPDGAGGLYVVGTTPGNLAATNLGGNDVWAARYDSTGNRQWTIQFGSSGQEGVGCAEVDGSGVLFGGSTNGDLGNPMGQYDIFYGRIDSAGNLLWIRQFGTTGDDTLHDIAVPVVRRMQGLVEKLLKILRVTRRRCPGPEFVLVARHGRVSEKPTFSRKRCSPVRRRGL